MRRRLLSLHRLVTSLDQLDRMIAWADDVEDGVNAKEAGVLGPGMPMSEIGLSESANPCTLLARAEVKRFVSCCIFLTRVRAAFKVLKNAMMRRCFFYSCIGVWAQFTPFTRVVEESRNTVCDVFE